MNTLKISDLTIFGFLAAGALAGYFMGVNAIVILFGGLLLVLSISFLIMKSQSTEKIIQLNVQDGEDDKKYIKKYKQADVGRFTSVFLFTGLSISILSSIYAFDLTVLEPEANLSTRVIIDEDDFEIIPPTLKNEKEKKKAIPKIKEPEPEVELEKDPILELVADEVLLEKDQPKIQDKAIDTDQKVSEKVVEEVLGDLNKMTEDDLKEEAEEETEEPVFMFVEEQPSFEGGEAGMLKFIYKNIKYPSIAKDNNIEGKCFVSFIIEKDGSVSNAKIVRDIGGGCGDEAIRVVNNMPKWSPGKQRGKAVRVSFNLPVVYKLN